MDGHHRFVEHVSVADSALGFAPLFKAVEQVDKVMVLVGITQFLEDNVHRGQGGFYQIDEVNGGFDKVFLVTADLVGQVLGRQSPRKLPGLIADFLVGEDLV